MSAPLPPDLPVPPGPATLTTDPWTDLRRHTQARIALGRCGVSVPTAELLRFGLAHAQARDAVQLALDADALCEALHAEGWSSLRTASAAPDRATYLLRPDLGRRLAAPQVQALRTRRPAADPELLIVIGDGLSSLAIARQALPLLRAIRASAPEGEAAIGRAEAPIVVATQARVALGDMIGEALGARMVAVLIGERPGLSSPDSLGLYLTREPRTGRTDAERNCISNIRPEGLSHERAAYKFWWHVLQARAQQATGVALKDMSDTQPLPGLGAPRPA
ncbi:ethanolamine ammonia-lyase light chain [Sphaerotilus hippei]|uniref:Ethanolamine ammonia-lyase small subunit n=1 Tax=Sphaerotilus hippei TaxID=744406 RepID=A0A318HBR8_9BURK|nr:ethanolamine ammonia-lyase subunit EutC [Sphaerotilus hippei]PXW98179.1 ethanolamine ammonia-lyase light chain [Sphaerotilus hippei]